MSIKKQMAMFTSKHAEFFNKYKDEIEKVRKTPFEKVCSKPGQVQLESPVMMFDEGSAISKMTLSQKREFEEISKSADKYLSFEIANAMKMLIASAMVLGRANVQ